MYMKCTLFQRFILALAASLYFAAIPLAADEPAKADSPKDAPKEAATLAEQFSRDLELQHSRFLLSDAINESVANLSVDIGLAHANGLGVDVAVPEAALKAQLNLPKGQGLTVTQVPDDSIGAKAGLKVHDVIIGVGDENVDQPTKLSELLNRADGKSV